MTREAKLGFIAVGLVSTIAFVVGAILIVSAGRSETQAKQKSIVQKQEKLSPEEAREHLDNILRALRTNSRGVVFFSPNAKKLVVSISDLYYPLTGDPKRDLKKIWGVYSFTAEAQEIDELGDEAHAIPLPEKAGQRYKADEASSFMIDYSKAGKRKDF